MADWFALLNNKMGGDLKKIQTVGRYMIEIWRAVGMDMRNVEFLWASEEINAHSNDYWSRVMEIARLNNLARCVRTWSEPAGQASQASRTGGRAYVRFDSNRFVYPCRVLTPAQPSTPLYPRAGYSGAAPSWGGRTRTS